MPGIGKLRAPPRVRLNGLDHFINRLSRWDDLVARARVQSICSEIWWDARQADLDHSLNRYRPWLARRDQDLHNALRLLADKKKKAIVTHAVRVVQQFLVPFLSCESLDIPRDEISAAGVLLWVEGGIHRSSIYCC